MNASAKKGNYVGNRSVADSGTVSLTTNLTHDGGSEQHPTKNIGIRG